MNQTFVPVAPRRAPVNMSGLAPWLRNNLFSSVPNALVTVLMLAVLVWAAKAGIAWGVVHAVTAADADACQAARGIGACWGVLHEKARFILLGRYPQTEHWRPEVATFLLLGLVVASCSRWFWKPWLAMLWGVGDLPTCPVSFPSPCYRPAPTSGKDSRSSSTIFSGVLRMRMDALRIFLIVVGTVSWLLTGPQRAGAGP